MFDVSVSTLMFFNFGSSYFRTNILLSFDGYNGKTVVSHPAPTHRAQARHATPRHATPRHAAAPALNDTWWILTTVPPRLAEFLRGCVIV